MDIEDVRRAARPVVEARGRNVGLSAEDCEGLLQEVLMKYLRAWHGSSKPVNVGAQLGTHTARAITDQWRAERRRPTVAKVEDPYGEPLDPVERVRSRQPSMPAVGDAVIEQVFGLLSAADAALFRRRLVDDVDPVHLADELGISRAAVDPRVSRARARLQALPARPELLDDLRAQHSHL